MDRERMKPVAAGISFAVLFGLSFIYTKGALDYVDPYRFIGFRFALEPVAQTSGGAEEDLHVLTFLFVFWRLRYPKPPVGMPAECPPA